eukprot:scaffold50222_cov39-Prasinocladus_malaysianus.AAC.1
MDLWITETIWERSAWISIITLTDVLSLSGLAAVVGSRFQFEQLHHNFKKSNTVVLYEIAERTLALANPQNLDYQYYATSRTS